MPTHGGPILMPAGYLRGPLEQSFREAHRDVLLFTSAPLEAPLLVLGRIALEAWVATATAESDLVARLCDVHPDGRSYNIVDGILRVRSGRAVVDLWSTRPTASPPGTACASRSARATSRATTAARARAIIGGGDAGGAPAQPHLPRAGPAVGAAAAGRRGLSRGQRRELRIEERVRGAAALP